MHVCATITHGSDAKRIVRFSAFSVKRKVGEAMLVTKEVESGIAAALHLIEADTAARGSGCGTKLIEAARLYLHAYAAETGRHVSFRLDTGNHEAAGIPHNVTVA